MSDYYILDDNGDPVKCHNIYTWAQWLNSNKKQVSYENVGGIDVSTVFLGLDHIFVPEYKDRPILWETMVFDNKNGLDWQQRFTSKQEALAFHEKVVTALKDIPSIRDTLDQLFNYKETLND